MEVMPFAEPVRRVLVIDDQLDHIEIVAALLRREGYQVEASTDARAAVHRAAQDPPDLVLLDLWMPTVDGFQAAQLLRADPRTRNVPIIFLSACGETVAEANGVDLGSVDYLHKPFHAVELLEMAAAALRSHGV
jgi:DNA-binding response OmpR family regulator